MAAATDLPATADLADPAGSVPAPLPAPLSLAPSAIAYALLFGAVGAWSPYSTVFYRSLGIDLARIGILAAVPAAVTIVAAPAWGLLADRLGDVRPLLLVSATWAAVVALVLAAGPPVAVLGVVVALMAAGSAALAPLLDARTVQRLGRDRERYGRARLWGSVAFIVVSIAVGALVDVTSPVASLLVYAPLLAGGGLAGALLLGRSRRAAGVPLVSPLAAARLLRDPTLRLFFVGSVLVWTAANGVTTFFSLRIVQLGGDARLVGVGWAMNAVAEVPLMFAFASIARRAGVPRLIVLGALVFAVRAAGWAVVDSAVGSVLVTTIGGCGYALFVVGSTSFVSSRAPAALRATAQGLFSGTAYATGSILGAVLAGQLAGSTGLSAVFPAGALASVAGALLVWIAIARRSPRGFEEPAPGG